MKSVKFTALIMALSILLGLTACSTDTDTQAPETETPLTTATPITTVPRIDKDIEGLFTAQEMTDIFGVEMGEPKVMGQGASIECYAVDSYNTFVKIDIMEQTFEHFVQFVPTWYPDCQDAPNIGEMALYSPQLTHLVIYDDGHMFTIELSSQNVEDDELKLLMSPEIAVLLLERY